jgi:ribulose 1,5-bisphosphate synthetase/thiazole synthase
LLSVMPSTSEIVTDIDNQIYKQLQDRLNQDEVVTGQGSSGQGAGIR